MPTCQNLGYSTKDILLFKYNGTPAQTDAFLVLDTITPTVNQSSQEHNLTGDGNMNNIRKSYDKNNMQAEIAIAVLAEGTGAAGTAPKISDFYKAAGFTETVDAGNSVTYVPHMDSIPVSTAVIYKGGNQKTTYSDLVAGFKISGAIGEDIKVEFSLKGFTDLIKTNETPTTGDIAFHDAFRIDYITAVTVSGTTINIESFELSLNENIVQNYFTELRCANRTDIQPSISVTAVKQLNDASAWTDFLNQTAREIKIVAHNRVGETLTIEAKNALPQPVEDSDSDSVLTETRPYDLKSDTNGVSFSIKYA